MKKIIAHYKSGPKMTKFGVLGASAIVAVSSAFATDPVPGDIVTAAQTATISFLTTIAPAIFGLLLTIVAFKLAWGVVRSIKGR